MEAASFVAAGGRTAEAWATAGGRRTRRREAEVREMEGELSEAARRRELGTLGEES